MSTFLARPLLAEDVEPWEQQRGESRQAYAAWVAYRDMEGPRSYRRLAQDLHRSVTLIGGWGRKWHWQRRIDAYLDYLEKVRMSERIRVIAEMNDRHASVGKLGLEKVSEALKAIQGRDLPLSALPKLLATSVAIERMARGLSATGPQLSGVDSSEFPRSQRPTSLDMVSEKIKRLSAIDRDLLRRLSLQYMQVITLEAELVEAEPRESGLTNNANEK